MDQAQTNQAEWAKPENWSSKGVLAVYFSKADTRVWVPKARPALGWTLNLAHRAGVLWLLALLLMPTAVLAALLALRPCATGG